MKQKNLSKPKRLLCLCLSLLLLLPAVALTGCHKKGADKDTQNPGGNVSSSGYPLDFSGKDYDGYEFNFLRYDAETDRGWTGIPNDIFSEGMSADVLENAVYNRNNEVSKMLNVKIGMRLYGSGLSTHLQNDCLSGDPSYDAIIQVTTYLYQLFNLGLLKNMSTLNLDTSYDWWDQNSINTLTVNGKTFGMVSDITYIDKLSTVGVFFNTGLAESLQLGNLFDLVDSGKWDYETFTGYAKTATDSLEGVTGISCQNDASYFFLHAAGLKTAGKVGGEIQCLLRNTRQINVLQDIFRMMNSNYFFNRQSAGLDVTDTIKKFAQSSENLFMVRPLQSYYNIKDYSDNYGILPMPKYDSASDTYYSPINIYSAGTLCLPYTAQNNERIADVLQAMGMVSRSIVMPEFYDTVLGLRFANDLQSSRMLDIIFQNRVYDIGMIWNFGDLRSILVLSGAALEVAENTVASNISGSYDQIKKGISNFLTAVDNYTN